MGKKRYKEKDVSKQMTEALGIADLLALKTSTASHYYTVHERYFSGDKLTCPACGSPKTRCSKVVKRTFKDILWDEPPTEENEEQGFKVFDLTFYQRYLRCDGCNSSVFPEPIDFGDKGCRYTNRLSDALADGTFRFSYKKVCAYFGVPASTASIGPIMRRRIQYRESLLLPISTPKKLGIMETIFFREAHPIVFALCEDGVYCIEEYEHWKSLTIFEAVTKGLYTPSEMRDSQVRWIGLIPNSWNCCALKMLTTKIGSGKTPAGGAEVYSDTGIVFLRSQNIYDTGLQLNDVSYISQEIDEEMKNTRVQYDDVLLNITGGSIGRCCVYNLKGVSANVNQHVCIIRTDTKKLLPKDSKVKKAAKSNDRQVYERSIFPGIFDTTAQQAYMRNTEAYEQLFLDAEKYRVIQRALAERLYRELHGEGN